MVARSDDIKAAVMAALLAGQSVSAVAKRYNLPKGTVSTWKIRGVGLKNETQKSDIGKMLMDVLAVNISAEKSLLEKFQDVNWQDKQDASSLGVLYGIVKDKQLRMFDAFNAASEKEDE